MVIHKRTQHYDEKRYLHLKIKLPSQHMHSVKLRNFVLSVVETDYPIANMFKAKAI